MRSKTQCLNNGGYKRIYYSVNGTISREEYFLNNQYHSEDSASIIHYIDGRISHERYWLNGTWFSKDKWLMEIKKLKLKKIISKIKNQGVIH